MISTPTFASISLRAATAWPRAARGLLAAAALGLAPAAGQAAPLLSEVLYDASGPDAGFTFAEIHAPPGTSLDGVVLEAINGANGAVTDSVTLSGVVSESGLFVVADDAGGGTANVPNADLVTAFDPQNGPESIVLRDADGVLDALGYGVFGPDEVFAGEGSPAPDASAGSALARRFADVDTDDNLADWVVAEPTPGTAPFAALPEPGTAPSLALALAALGLASRRRR